MPTSVNILTLVDRVEKTAPGFRSLYDALSEYAHPNWAGTFGAFGTTITETIELELGPVAESPGRSAGLSTLSHTLMGFELFYNMSGELVRQLNDYFEQQAVQ